MKLDIKEFIAIGDIAGRCSELQQLLDQICPQRNLPIISLGDPNDRGKDSKGLYGMNMDSSHGNILSAVHWSSQKIVSAPYI